MNNQNHDHVDLLAAAQYPSKLSPDDVIADVLCAAAALCASVQEAEPAIIQVRIADNSLLFVNFKNWTRFEPRIRLHGWRQRVLCITSP